MFSASAKVDIDVEKIRRRFQQRQTEAQRWLHGAIIKDTDMAKVVPMDTGRLKGSPRRADSKGYTLVTWIGPYARRLYYGVTFNFSRDKHPRATHHWFETAKDEFLDSWGKGVAKIFGGTWGRGA